MDTNERATHSLLPPEEYFTKAANADYVYAYNNLSMLEAKEIFSTSGMEQREHVDKYIDYLTKSAEGLESWACKKLGLFYYNGIIGYEDKQITFKERIDKNLSLYFFKDGVKLRSNTALTWSCLYLMVYFPEEYKDNLPLLEEHLLHCCNFFNQDAMVFLCNNIAETNLNKISENLKHYFIELLKKENFDAELIAMVEQILYKS